MSVWMGGRRRELAEADAALDDGLRGGFLICPLVTVIGAKGGSSKTTTAAAMLHLLGQRDRVAGMLLGVDVNPDVGDLLERSGIASSRVPERLVDFAAAPDAVRHPVDWAPLLDITGRIHMLHNQGVTSDRIEAVTAEQWATALGRARRFSSLVIADAGTGNRHPLSIAAVEQATSLVIATRADALAIDKTAQAVAELVQAGHEDLVARATVVLSEVDKSVRSESYAPGREFLASRVRRVVVVPYDRAAGAVGAVDFGAARPATHLAWRQILASVVEDLRQQQAKPERSNVSDGPAGRIDAGAVWPARPEVAEDDASDGGAGRHADSDVPEGPRPVAESSEPGGLVDAAVDDEPEPVTGLPTWVRLQAAS